MHFHLIVTAEDRGFVVAGELLLRSRKWLVLRLVGKEPELPKSFAFHGLDDALVCICGDLADDWGVLDIGHLRCEQGVLIRLGTLLLQVFVAKDVLQEVE